MTRSTMLLLGAPILVSASIPPPVTPLTTIAYRADGTAGKLIAMPVRVNGTAPRWFVLDTGAPRSALDGRLAAELKLGSTRTSREGGTGHGTVAAGHPAPFDLSIGSVRLRVADPLTLDFASVPISKEDRGLVGSELISNYVVRIDPVSRRLSIFDPRSFRPLPGDVRLPLGIDGEHRRFYLDAVLHVRPGLIVRHRLRIDTGSEDSIDDPIVKRARHVTATRLGNGLGANYLGASGIYDAIEIGPYRIDHVWGPGGDLPAVGMEMLRRFVVTFDAPHRMLYLRPTRALGEPVPPPS